MQGAGVFTALWIPSDNLQNTDGLITSLPDGKSPQISVCWAAQPMALPGIAEGDVLLAEGGQGAEGGFPSLPGTELLQEPGAAQTPSPCWGPAEVAVPRLSPAPGAAGQEREVPGWAQGYPHHGSDRTWGEGLRVNTTSESLPRQLPVLPHKNLLQ